MPISTTTRRHGRPGRLAAALLLASAVSLTAPAAEAAGQSGDGFAGSSHEAEAPAGGTTCGTPSGPVGPTLPGIDVSHWQEEQAEINWSKVADAGTRFAFMKATESDWYVDPTFVSNRAEARANDLLVGAYHFARPDPSDGDARREARWFVRHADPAPGAALPVLDIETDGGMSPWKVRRWIRAWIAEVRRRIGVTAMVYTSPCGWIDRTANTRVAARGGSPLWVAHWGVDEPSVPAAGWDGRGWTVWQFTSHGRVAGVPGRVDQDLLAGDSLGPITIRRLAIQVDGPGRVSSDPAGYGCLASCEHAANPDAEVTLTVQPDDDAVFTGWTGACTGLATTCTVRLGANRSVAAGFVDDLTAPTPSIATTTNFSGPTAVRFDEPVRGVTARNVLVQSPDGPVPMTRTCRNGSGGLVPCDGFVRSVSLSPREPLVPGREYVARVDPPGAAPVVDQAGNAAPETTRPFEAARAVEQGTPPVTRSPLGAWHKVRDGSASGGSFVLTGRSGASAKVQFDGTGISLVTVTGPNRGRAELWIDGSRLRTVDLYSPVRTFGVTRRVTGLPSGRHTLRVVAAGRARPAATGRLVAIDRFDVLG